jgi:hypothetical protein
MGLRAGVRPGGVSAGLSAILDPGPRAAAAVAEESRARPATVPRGAPGRDTYVVSMMPGKPPPEGLPHTT